MKMVCLSVVFLAAIGSRGYCSLRTEINGYQSQKVRFRFGSLVKRYTSFRPNIPTKNEDFRINFSGPFSMYFPYQSFMPEPNLHRTICKRCGNILKPCTSAELSICDRDPNMCLITCSVCGSIRRFSVNAKYKLWFDDPKSVVEKIRYDDEPDDGAR